MPIYEYQCKSCGFIFEREHAIGEKRHYRCPECSCLKTQKLVSQVGVIFKGTGFYVTDSRKSNTGGNGGSGSSAGKKSEISSESISEMPSPASEN